MDLKHPDNDLPFTSDNSRHCIQTHRWTAHTLQSLCISQLEQMTEHVHLNARHGWTIKKTDVCSWWKIMCRNDKRTDNTCHHSYARNLLELWRTLCCSELTVKKIMRLSCDGLALTWATIAVREKKDNFEIKKSLK